MTVMFFRALIIYFLMLLVLRLMGKRQIGELQPSELVTTLLLSEIASQPIADDNIPLVYGIVPVVVVLSFEVILSYIVTKSSFLKRALTGTPSILINKGKIDMTEMKKTRLSVEELIGELRLKGVYDISQVRYAIMEKNGKLSVINNAQSLPLTPQDMNITSVEHGIGHPVVVDGCINKKNLLLSGCSKNRIKREMKNYKITDISDILLFTCDDAGQVTVVRKEHGK